MSKYHGVLSGNGLLGIISSQQPLKNDLVLMAGSYDLYGRGGVSNLFPAIDFLEVDLKLDGVTVDTDHITDYAQRLDMKHGQFGGSFLIPGKAQVNYTLRALRHLPNCALLTIDITPMKEVNLTVTNRHRVPAALRNTRMRQNTYTRRHARISILSTDADSPTGRHQLSAGSAILLPDSLPVTLIDHRTPDSDSHYLRINSRLAPGVTTRIGITGALVTSTRHPDPSSQADRLTLYAALQGIPTLIRHHEAAWEQLWKGDIRLTGNAQLQQDVHNMLYHLYSSVNESLPECGLSPMGLSGLGYNGHVFWDADVWMLPVLAVLHPQLACRMTDYRYNRLEAARRNAADHGYYGAMFPWESSDTGCEETPVWALTGTYEHHITGCVAWGAWISYAATLDSNLLRQKVWPLLRETADFWVSRIERDPDGSYHIRNVVCADEWAENVDDNAFTNAVAMTNLQLACRAAKLLKEEPRREWELYAHSLPLLQLPDGTHREHAAYHGEPIKQADVNLLAYPLQCVTDSTQILRDLRYYASRIPKENTPAMTHAIFSLLYARLGHSTEASHYLQEAYLPNLCEPFRTLAECRGGDNPYFLTGAGGVLQALIMGFGGYELGLPIRQKHAPLLPPGCSSIEILRSKH